MEEYSPKQVKKTSDNKIDKYSKYINKKKTKEIENPNISNVNISVENLEYNPIDDEIPSSSKVINKELKDGKFPFLLTIHL